LERGAPKIKLAAMVVSLWMQLCYIFPFSGE
jgi:hypothetical protein